MLGCRPAGRHHAEGSAAVLQREQRVLQRAALARRLPVGHLHEAVVARTAPSGRTELHHMCHNVTREAMVTWLAEITPEVTDEPDQ